MRYVWLSVVSAMCLSAQPKTFTNSLGMEMVLIPAGEFSVDTPG